MIDGCFYSMAKKHITCLLRFVPTHAIDDTTFVGAFEDELQYGTCLFLLLISTAHIQTQVGTVERRNECLRILLSQLIDNILTRNLIGCSGQGDIRNRRELFTDGSQLGIFRSEGVSPLRDTMRFVDSEEGYLDFS